MLHCGENLFSVKLVPGRGDCRCTCIASAHESDSGFEPVRVAYVGVAENYTARGLYLIVKELAEVFHIHFAFLSVDYRGICVYSAIVQVRAFDRADNVGKLADARRFYKDTVGAVFRINLFQSFRKVADERTADTARIEFVYLNARVLQKSAVDAYLSEFVFYQYEFFACISFLYKFFDKRGFACA